MPEFSMSNSFWKSAYVEGIDNTGLDELPWNIGEPQPEIAAVIPELSGPLLDAGCGVGVTACYCASLGKVPVVGLDVAEAAIEQARARAEEAGLSDVVTFEVADISNFDGYDQYFNAIVDCTLFHSLPVELRDGYQQAIFRAAAPGAQYVVLTFAVGSFDTGESNIGPNAVTKDEIESIIGQYWIVDSVNPAYIHTRHSNEHTEFSIPLKVVVADHDEQNRPKLKAWLVRAHKP